jgi:hypothetical protein
VNNPVNAFAWTDDADDLAPACGIVNGLIIVTLFWAIAWLVLR